jgi:hypothetical protein
MTIRVALMLGLVAFGMGAGAEERQITFTPKNHELDNNDNFSPDGRFLCYDTRETVGPGIDNCQSIEMVEISTGVETLLYQPEESVIGENPAPGVGAVSFSPVANKVAFIHGPPVAEVPVRGAYGKPNRNGAEVPADGSGRLSWLDKRDIATDRDTQPGAHRGGTHRHEYSLDGRRIGFTYDDFLLPQYDRTVGYMEPHPEAPAPATHYFAVLVTVVPKGTSKPGEIEKAWADSWVGREGQMRAFIGQVRNDDGETYEQSLFVVDVPGEVDITTADAGSATRFPAPPEGVRIRRLTHTWADGIVRGSADGRRIAYYAKDENGDTQIFVIPSDASDRDPDPAKRPVQATHVPGGVDEGNLRWHPSGKTLFCIADNGVAAVCVEAGPRFGEVQWLTPRGDTPIRYALTSSLDGSMLAFNKAVPAQDADGKPLVNYQGEAFSQIFVLPYPGEE